MSQRELSVMRGAEMIHDFQNKERGVLLLHGFLGSPFELSYLAGKIREAGYSIYVPRYPGHGTRLEEMAETTGRDWYKAAREAYLELRSRCAEVSVVGLSMGSLFAARLAAEFAIPRIVLMSMPAAITDKAIYATPILRHFVRIIYDGEEKRAANKKGINNPADRAVHVCYDQGTPVAQAWELHKIIKLARAALPAVKARTLVIQSRGDEVIPPWSMDYILSRIGTAAPEALWLEKSNHVVCFDHDKDLVAEMVLRFLASETKA